MFRLEIDTVPTRRNLPNKLKRKPKKCKRCGNRPKAVVRLILRNTFDNSVAYKIRLCKKCLRGLIRKIEDAERKLNGVRNGY